MAAALDAGATIVNDVSALAYDPLRRRSLAARGCPVVLMHMRGTPADMHAQARYDDVAADVTRRAWRSGSRPPNAPASRATGSPSIPASASPRPPNNLWSCCAGCPNLARARPPHPRRRVAKVVPRGCHRASTTPAADCRAPSPPGCSRCRGAPPSCGCMTSRKPFRRSRSGRPWRPDGASIAPGAQATCHFSTQGGPVDDTRETPVRNRRHPRHREYRSDDRRDRAAAGPGGRLPVHPRQPSPSRGDRQGHPAVRLHDGAGAHRRLHRRGHGRDAGRAAADAGDRDADAQPARRSRRDDLRLAQSVSRTTASSCSARTASSSATRPKSRSRR